MNSKNRPVREQEGQDVDLKLDGEVEDGEGRSDIRVMTEET